MSSKTNILPLTYLGNIQYFSKLCFEPCIIDIHENYVKQSFRNRCDILSANGPISLTVNLIKPPTLKCAVKDMRIDYSKRWQHQHWLSIVSAYRSSPYFEHFEDQFAPFYHKQYDFLLDYDLELTQLALRLMGSQAQITLSDKYVIPTENHIDMRGIISPKCRTENADPDFHPTTYYQVFSERMPFVPNLSIIDLIFCEKTLRRSNMEKVK